MSETVPERDGRVVTFYSYKGGTGRSMALANVAWVLASAGKRVLCIDWDLEAPGLHRYFAPFLIDPELFSTDGMIDFVWTVSQAAVTPPPAAGDASADGVVARDLAEFADVSDYVSRLGLRVPRIKPDARRPTSALEDNDDSEYDLFANGGILDLFAAGRQSAVYAERVNTFDWDNFYERLGGGGR